MAAVALANGLNATMLRKWVTQSQGRELASPLQSIDASARVSAPASSGFVPLALTASAPAAEIHIELQRSGTTLKVSWPGSAAAECAAWLRELLR